MERKIPDKNAAQFFQGFYTARTGIALKPPQLSQHEASSLCITTN
jgi:hypothetical protein